MSVMSFLRFLATGKTTELIMLIAIYVYILYISFNEIEDNKLTTQLHQTRILYDLFV
jgi:hypothetical protein